jgi:D-amino-acid dehydrogenase
MIGFYADEVIMKSLTPPASVAIVGGGVVGTMAAYYLNRAGCAVTVLDKGTIGGGCSHGNCGYICPSHVLPLAVPGALTATLKTLFSKNSPLKVRPGFALRNLGWFLNFARKCNRRSMMTTAVGLQALLNSSRQLYDELLHAEQLEVEWDTYGLMFVFQTKKAFDHYSETDHLLSESFARPARRFDADALQKAEPALKPGSVAGGYLYDGDAQLRPDVLMTELRKLLTNRGVTFVEQAEMTGFASEGGKAVAVTTTQGDHRADAFLVATGAWTPLLQKHLGGKLPIIPGKGYSITLKRPKVCPTYPMIFEEHRVAVSPFASGFRIGSTMEFSGYDDTLNRSRLQLLRDGAAHYLHETDAPAFEEWWGWRPMTSDGLPIIDRSRLHENVLIAAGHGMLGLSMATGTGKLVQELLTDVTPHLDARPYRVERF